MKDSSIDVWYRYGRRRRLFSALFIGFFPGIYLLGMQLPRLLHWGRLGVVVAGLWLLALSLSWISLISIRCPRCGRSLFLAWRIFSAASQECGHCGWSRWGKE